MRSTPSVRICVLAASLLVATCVAGAAPVIPRMALPDEVFSLVRLDRVGLKIDAVDQRLVARGLTFAKVAAHCRDALEEGGVKVVADDDELPRVVVQVQTATGPDFPDAVAIEVVIAVHQRIVVSRLDRPMRAPTSSVSILKVATREKSPVVGRRAVTTALESFLRLSRLATAHWERGE
ncbi:MAG: hypothetical protein CMJ18_19355 [Phycisphaeraceae bacterium]|nr:hypothetical protein [Phycisphaeraceae bacterium]